MATKIILILMYLVIIILIPLFLSYLLNITIMKKRWIMVKKMAVAKSISKNKPLVIFYGDNNGIIVTKKAKKEFVGNIIDVSGKMSDNSCVVVLVEVLEYFSLKDLTVLVKQLKRISGGDLYAINVEKNSPRIFWDYKIKHVMDAPYFFPKDKIDWKNPNDLQLKIQTFYSYVFRVLPYNFFVRKTITIDKLS